MVVILLCSIGILTASYFLFDCNPWLSGVFVSAGCGGITGLVLYFLSNLRNNKCAILQKEYKTLKDISDILSQVSGFKAYHAFYKKAWGKKRDVFEDGHQIVLLLEELQSITDDMMPELFSAFTEKEDNPLSFEILQLFKNRFSVWNEEKDVLEWINSIIEHFASVEDKIFEMLREREDQLMFMGKYFM